MATRTIVTSQPDVACDVCERRLLRGEQPDVFLAAGRRRTVCELCAPRAVHEGWMRESERQTLNLAPLRPRRGRSFFDRLRQVGRPTDAAADIAPAGVPYEREPPASVEPEPYDFLEGYAGAGAEPVPATPREPALDTAVAAPAEESLPVDAGASEPSAELRRAIEAFNESEFPRRVAGVARSLGAPEVSVRVTEHAASVIAIVVAWELCWYRYEVDLDDQPVEARIVAQGTELSELAREDRLVNALAGESGTLSL